MFRKLRCQFKSLTLIEITVATLLIALTLIGLANLFIAGKRHILHSRSRMAGGEMGKLFLEPLQMSVRQDNWNQAGNALLVTTTYCDSDPAHASQQNPVCPPSINDRTLDGIEYSARYEISVPFQPSSDLRKVVTTISWNEPTP